MLDNSQRESHAHARRRFDRLGWMRVEFDSTVKGPRHKRVPDMATVFWCNGGPARVLSLVMNQTFRLPNNSSQC